MDPTAVAVYHNSFLDLPSSEYFFEKFQFSPNNFNTSTACPALVALVACGSFSPVTNLHLRIFEEAKNYLMYNSKRENKDKNCHVIIGIASPVHDAYGKSSLIAAEHRVQMVQMATKKSHWIQTSTLEVMQKGWVPTATVLRQYGDILTRQARGNKVRAMLLCGADMLQSMKVPGLWHQEHLDIILGQNGVVVIERVNMNLEKIIEENEILKKYKQNIVIVPQIISNTVSSTSVRALLANNLSVRWLIPEEAEDYIAVHGLYGVHSDTYIERHYGGKRPKLVEMERFSSSTNRSATCTDKTVIGAGALLEQYKSLKLSDQMAC